MDEAGLPERRSLAAREPAVLPVSLLVSSARLILERHLGLVWVRGEISNFTRAPSGHSYFNLKDDAAQVRCVFFKSKAQFIDFALRDGLQVEVRATASIYEARGEFQLNVETMRQAGLGALYERFARLKARLEAAGWFAAERKRALPAFPRVAGVVTSTAAAALRDVLSTLRRRWPALRIIVYPTAVQGPGAGLEIARAVRTANARAEADVLIICRGGGSIEDLWAYNEECVAQALFESAIPTVSGVGHETDFTICDFVADVRAPTPTAAAELVAPDCAAISHRVRAHAAHWRRCGQRLLETRMQRLDAANRALVHPAARLSQQAREAQSLAARLATASRHQLALAQRSVIGLRERVCWRLRTPLAQWARLDAARECWQRCAKAEPQRRRAQLAALAQNLAHLSPQGVLERGYSIVTAGDGRIVQEASQVSTSDRVALTFARGGAKARIEDVEP